MLTFKQLEAIFWIGKLGSFSLAADKLCTSQSAVSKRIQELEKTFGTELFDRTVRTARLTDKGEEMFSLAKSLLHQRDCAIEQLSNEKAIERRVRIGVTELTAMTWLPRLVKRIREHYPKVILEPDVDCSESLRDKILADDLDLIFVPDVFADTPLRSVDIGTVESAWMCRPDYIQTTKPIKLTELSEHCLLIQGRKSGTGMIYDDWMKAQGLKATQLIVVNNLLALIGLTVSGLGISYLPKKCADQMLSKGLLNTLQVVPALPPVQYVAICRDGYKSNILSSIISFSEECCDFNHTFQAPGVAFLDAETKQAMQTHYL